VAVECDVRLTEPQRLARRDPDLCRDEVDAGQRLGDGVLDLDPAVDLDEVRVAVAVDEELERADVLVARGDGSPNGAFGQLRTSRRRQRRRGRLLENLLVAPLDRTVALAQVDALPVAVDSDLDLDVSVVLDPALEVERVVAERRLGLGAADLDGRLELPRRADHPHALAAAAGRRLDQHRVADSLGLLERVLVVAQHPIRTRDRLEAVRRQQPARALLAAETLEHLGRRADERQVVRANDVGKALVLREEAVAGMDRVAAGHDSSRNHRGG
jgi:hypothetical protein